MANNSLHILYKDNNITVGRCGPIFMMHWKNRTSRELITKCNQLFQETLTDMEEKIYTISIISKNANLPDHSIKRIFSNSLDYYADNSISSCSVIIGTGIRVSTTKSVTDSKERTSRLENHKQFAETEDAIKYLSESSGEDTRIAKEEIKSAVEEFMVK